MTPTYHELLALYGRELMRQGVETVTVDKDELRRLVRQVRVHQKPMANSCVFVPEEIDEGDDATDLEEDA